MLWWDEFCNFLWRDRAFESFWFPPDYTWKDFENTDNGIYHPQLFDLLYVIPLSIVIAVLRILFERYIGYPLGLKLGLKAKSNKRPITQPILEEAYQVTRFPDHDVIVGLSKKTGLAERQVQRWLRMRRNQNRASVIIKFTESSWRLVYYFCILVTGISILWDKSYVWDLSECWKKLSEQHMTTDVFCYYLIEMAFYVSLLVSQFFDVQRKDFWLMLTHHLATLTLMSWSWFNQFWRIGIIILCLHDICDVFLEFSKLFTYLKYTVICNLMFVSFFLSWIVTRLIIFPFWIINETMFSAVKEFGFCTVYYLYNFCLVTLQILHIVWFFFIMRVLYQVFTKGRVEKDARSESEESVSEDEKVCEPQENGGNKMNKTNGKPHENRHKKHQLIQGKTENGYAHN